MLNPCGANCQTCKDFQQECTGCRQSEGKVFWTQYIDVETCPIYSCAVIQKQQTDCSTCNELPCNMFSELKDPERSDAEHELSIQERVAALRAKNI